MRSQNAHEKLLIRYLLGKLNDDERVQVEDRAFADSGYLSALEATEADLIDAYVRKELPKSDCEAFERHFLTSPVRRSKVQFARTFFRLAAELNESSISERRSASPTFAALFRRWHPGLRFAAGIAALACLITASWLSVENALMRSRVTALESQQRDAELRRRLLLRQLSDEHSRIADLTRLRQHTARDSGPVIASLVLVSGVSRAQSNVPLLALTPSVQIAHFEIDLESRDAFPRFRAGLRTRSGTELLTYSSLVPRRTATGNEVSFDVPASGLPAGDYELAVQGVSPGQPPQAIGYYYFRVQKG